MWESRSMRTSTSCGGLIIVIKFSDQSQAERIIRYEFNNAWIKNIRILETTYTMKNIYETNIYIKSYKLFKMYFEAIFTGQYLKELRLGKGQGEVVLPPSSLSYKKLWGKKLWFYPIHSKLWWSGREIGKISAIFIWNYKRIRRVDWIIR